MKTIQKVGFALAVLAIAYSCKQAEYEGESATEVSERAVATLNDAVTETTDAKVVSSSAAVEPKDSNKEFVRTADIRFRAKNVAKTTVKIEDATTKFGGYVTYTNLESVINDKSETRVSQDSILETIKFTVKNNVTIRIPNTRLDTLIKTIAKEIEFIDSRTIKADDVTLQLLTNEMARKRGASTQKRISNAIDNKGKKLNQIIDAEENLDQKKENNDARKLENLSLNEQVNYSTISLQIYQREVIQNALFASEKSINKYRPHLGLQLWEGVKTGWFMLESILAFIIQLWAVFLLVFLAWFTYKKYITK